jgi:hypothetical protein
VLGLVMLLGLVLVLGAVVADQRLGFIGSAVVSAVADKCLLGLFADVFGVDQQPLLAAFHLQDELGDRGVGGGFEGVSDPTALAGANVDTSLNVSNGNILTLTVHHKSKAYVYPVVGGANYETGYESVIVYTPPPPTPPAETVYWESADLYVGPPEPIPSNEASISTVGGSRKEFVRVICGHSAFYRSDGSYTEGCGNPFTGDEGFGVVWHAAMRGAFLFKPGAWAEQRGARACAGNGEVNSPLYSYYVEEAWQCHYGPGTSDGNGGGKVSAGHYLRAQAHWVVKHWALCHAECNGTPNPIIPEDKPLELHLWPSGDIDTVVP